MTDASGAPPAPPPGTPAHAGVLGWEGKELELNERVLAHWAANHGHLVLTDRRLLLLGHPHILTFHREVSWTSPLEMVQNLEVIQAPSIHSAMHDAAASTGSIGPSRAGGSSPGAIGVQNPMLEGSFQVVADGMVLFKGHPQRADEIRERIDHAMVERLEAVRRLPTGPADRPGPQGPSSSP
jgi:hypothetical protein